MSNPLTHPGKFTRPIVAVIHAVGLVGFLVVLVTSRLEPAFWTDAASMPADAVQVITVLFLLFPFLIPRIHKLGGPRADRILSYLYTAFAIAYILILHFLVVATGGLWLSPFSDFYATILLTVLILAPLDATDEKTHRPNRRWTIVLRPTSLVALTTFLTVLVHILGDPARVSPTLRERALDSPEDWEIGHGVFFFIVLASVFLVDLARDKRRDKRLKTLLAQVACLRDQIRETRHPASNQGQDT